MDDELLGIGAFSLLTGLTVTALRHYDELGLLAPARIDPGSRYRYYRREQIPVAHTVRALRAVDLPLTEIGELLREDDPERRRGLLARHRDRLAEREEQLAEQLSELNRLIEKGVAMPATTGNRLVMLNIPADDLERSRAFYEALLDVEFAREQHGDGPTHLNVAFGDWDTSSWFLVSLWPRTENTSADVGFLVDDLDRAYRSALAAGGSEVQAPRVVQGMPRNAQLRDPAGNHVGLYQR